MAIANKVQRCIEGSSWIRKMFEEGARLRTIYGDNHVFDFTIGNPSVEPPPAFRLALRQLAEQPMPGMHRYMSNAGYEETRTAVAAAVSARGETTVKAEHVVMTCGAGAALNVILKTILNPGDEVIILAPFFVEYKFYIDNHGGTTKEVWTNKETFQLDLSAIAAAITAQTKAIIVNSPNNPTGVIYPQEDLCALGNLLREKEKFFGHAIYVISDEPYARLAYDGHQVPPIFDCIDNCIVATSHSKDLALPGERIGYIAVNPKMDDAAAFIEGAIFCNRVLGFVNAPALMQRLVAGLQGESVDIDEYQEKRDLLYNHLTSLGFTLTRPDGAFYLFPRSPLADDIAFVNRAQEEKILLVPGTGFGAPGYFRIAYCIDIDIIRRSLPAWERLAKSCGL